MDITTGLYWTCGLGALVALGAIVLAQYRRMRRFQPAICRLDLSLEGVPVQSAFLGKQPDRVATALRAWSVERAQADLAPRSRSEDSETTAAVESGRELQLALRAMPKLTMEPAPWRDESQWLPDPSLATQTRPEKQPAVEPERQLTPPAAKHEEPSMPPAIEPAGQSKPPAAEPEKRSPLTTAEREEAATPPPADRDERFTPPSAPPLSQNADYYEVLQISPNADSETIHRVYRIMASRFHPDNPTTGNLERFLQLREAYQTLSDPGLRAEYDAARSDVQAEAMPIFWQKSFVDGIEGEANRRLGVLSLLYLRRRISEARPGVSVMELERRMAFPREYLSFTLWYLHSKGYVVRMDDNSDYALTSSGVDFVEGSSNSNRVIRELLATGTIAEQALRQTRRNVVVQFPRAVPKGAGRARVETPRRTQRRRLAGRRSLA